MSDAHADDAVDAERADVRPPGVPETGGACLLGVPGPPPYP
ncbi:hypothetical protein ACF1BE_04400 [Streptomyces sp. NPDC014991]